MLNLEKENKITQTKVKYWGGHPDVISNNVVCGDLIINNKYLCFVNQKLIFGYQMKSFKIFLNDLVNVEYKNEKDIQKDVTLTRMAFMGIYAFAAKKKRVTRNNYLIITYNQSGIENKILFETEYINPSMLVGIILKAKRGDYDICDSKYDSKINSDENNIKKDKCNLIEKDWFMWLLIVFMFPVGLYILWKRDRYDRNTRIIITTLIIFLAVISVIIPK